MHNSECLNQKRDILKIDEATRALMSPPGALNLPPLLEKRRLEHGIIDAIFTNQPVFDRVFVWQLPSKEGETYLPGGSIVQPDNFRSADDRECPKGIVVGAGLSALDTLRSHGIDLGHVVSIIAVQPWRLPMGHNEKNVAVGVLMLRDGDLVGSDDLALLLRQGKVKFESVVTAEGKRVHRLVDQDGQPWDPVSPWIPDDQ